MTRKSRQLRSADTEALLLQTREGDRDAYDELFRRYFKFAMSVARRGGAVDVDEAVAEAFRRTMSALDSGHGPTVAFGPYVATAIRSVIVEQRRRASSERAAGSGDDLLGDEVMVLDSVDVDPVLADAFVSLPERWKNVIWYSDVEGFKPREVARMMGAATANSVSTLRSRAHLGLRAAYLERLAGEGHTVAVREYLSALIDGGDTELQLTEEVRWHLEECDECAESAAKLAGLSGSKLPALLAPAVIAHLGFDAGPALLPARARLGIGESAHVARSGWKPFVVVASSAAAVAVAIGFAVAVPLDDRSGGPSAVSISVLEPADVLETQTPTPTTAVPTSTTTEVSTTVPASADAQTPPATTAPPTTTQPSTPQTTPPADPPSGTTATPTANPPTTTPTHTTPPTTATTTTTTTTTTTVPRDTTAPLPVLDTVVPPTTTTTPTTQPPTTAPTTTIPPSAGDLTGTWDSTGGIVTFDLSVVGLDGRPGAVLFSTAITTTNVQSASCPTTTRCDFSGVSSPDVVVIQASAIGPVTMTLLDENGATVDTSTAG